MRAEEPPQLLWYLCTLLWALAVALLSDGLFGMLLGVVEPAVGVGCGVLLISLGVETLLLAPALREHHERRALRSAFAGREESVEECRGWKLALLARHPAGALQFLGMHHGRYTAQEQAGCVVGCTEAPGVSCSCGFYVLRSPELAHALGAGDPDLHEEMRGLLVVLEVECYGTILEYELGWRVEYQEVLSCTLPACCIQCGEEAAGMSPQRRYVREEVMWELLSPRCERCAGEGELLTLPRLRAALGTELRRGSS